MAFDPTLPVNGSLIVAQELRDQFNGLADIIAAVPAGPTGPQGPDGAPGTRIYSGDVAPSAGLGNEGDLFLQSNNGDFFEKLPVVGWQATGNFTGPAGLQGNHIIINDADPDAGLGNIEDVYLKPTTGQVYQKVPIDGWVLVGNFTGPAGPEGNRIRVGAGDADPGLGAPDDLYINTSNGDLSLKTDATTWTLQSSLLGPPGPVTPSDLTAAIATTAPLPGTSALGLTVSNPPTQAEMQSLADKLDELINALVRPP